MSKFYSAVGELNAVGEKKMKNNTTTTNWKAHSRCVTWHRWKRICVLHHIQLSTCPTQFTLWASMKRIHRELSLKKGMKSMEWTWFRRTQNWHLFFNSVVRTNLQEHWHMIVSHTIIGSCSINILINFDVYKYFVYFLVGINQSVFGRSENIFCQRMKRKQPCLFAFTLCPQRTENFLPFGKFF